MLSICDAIFRARLDCHARATVVQIPRLMQRDFLRELEFLGGLCRLQINRDIPIEGQTIFGMVIEFTDGTTLECV